ncbi:MAG TPA: hypothetical protein DCE42_14120 [Myxococcales bacterium]|nr:hypothetical protein [Myxococcales bacterium]
MEPIAPPVLGDKALINEAELRAYSPKQVRPETIKHIHFIGVAGTGMGTLAGMLKTSGYRVTGSDQGIYPPMSDQLKAWEIETMTGFDPKHLNPAPDLVIVGNACRPSNPEVQYAVEQGIPCTSMPRAIHDFFLADRHSIVIAGTHGKTTTTALTGWLLESAGLKPGVFIGGVSKNFNGSFRLPEGKYFVIEGDEYDSALFDKVPKFIHYAPTYAVLTSVEFDHADIYDNIDQVKAAFLELMKRLTKDGQLWVCNDYPHGLDVAKTTKAPVTTYAASGMPELRATNIRLSEEHVAFDVYKNERKVANFRSPMFGQYNVANALAAIGVALALDISPEEIQKGLDTFEGIKRRQEIYARVGELIVIDDFAHHPTAIKVTSAAIRERFPNRRIWGIFEPRSNTARRNYFQELLPKSFDASDRVLLGWPFHFDKMEEEERLDIHKVIQDLKDQGKDAVAFPEVDQIVDYVTAKARPNDVILIMSNGGFGGIHRKITEALATRFQEK